MSLVVAIVFLVIAVLATMIALAMQVPTAASANAERVVLTVPAPFVSAAAGGAAGQVTKPVSPTVTYVPAPEGNWTSQRGIQIADRALAWVSWPYSWDAGDANGPTYGVAVDAASHNDARVRGFDCSGLVLYALAPWLNLAHSAAAQYNEAGSVHPALNQLQPGDLVFWSSDGTVDAIGHVAIYVGNGNVVQAPHSGALIGVVPLDQVESGRIGVTRPLS
ncbi:MAG: NlpC/P60 family protein [Jatrophihabitantaceae bacterium]